MSFPLKVLTIKHVTTIIKRLGFSVKKLSSTWFAIDPQSVSLILIFLCSNSPMFDSVSSYNISACIVN